MSTLRLPQPVLPASFVVGAPTPSRACKKGRLNRPDFFSAFSPHKRMNRASLSGGHGTSETLSFRDCRTSSKLRWQFAIPDWND
jgi:hypothetical protein